VVQIPSSRDLTRWARPTRDPIIEPGPPRRVERRRPLHGVKHLVDDEKITMYYAAFNNGHGRSDMNDPNCGKNIGQSGMATWRRDGWVSLTNGSTEGLGNPGRITTKVNYVRRRIAVSQRRRSSRRGDAGRGPRFRRRCAGDLRGRKSRIYVVRVKLAGARSCVTRAVANGA
jgi:hypothetical protein